MGKAQGLSLNTIVIAIIVLVVLFVVIFIITKGAGGFVSSLNCEDKKDHKCTTEESCQNEGGIKIASLSCKNEGEVCCRVI